MYSSAPISGFVRPSRASRAMYSSWGVSSSRVSSRRLRTFSPVASSSRRAGRRIHLRPSRRTCRTRSRRWTPSASASGRGGRWPPRTSTEPGWPDVWTAASRRRRLGGLSRLQGRAQVLQGPLLVLVVRPLARPDVGPHPVAGPVPEDVQAVVRLQVVDAHGAGVAGPGGDAPLLRRLAEAIPLVDVVAIARTGSPVAVQTLAGGQVLDVVAARRGHEGEFLVAASVGVVGDDVRPVGGVAVVDVDG